VSETCTCYDFNCESCNYGSHECGQLVPISSAAFSPKRTKVTAFLSVDHIMRQT
jgi:hypothetical protein